MAAYTQALTRGTLKLVLNQHQATNILAPTYAARGGAAVNEVLDRDLDVLVAAMCRIKDTPWDEVGEIVAGNCKHVRPDDLPGWEITIYREVDRAVATGKIGTVSATYRDEGSRECKYTVPVLHIWGGRDRPEIEAGAFIRHMDGECAYCGTDMEGQFYCPNCGSN